MYITNDKRSVGSMPGLCALVGLNTIHTSAMQRLGPLTMLACSTVSRTLHVHKKWQRIRW